MHISVYELAPLSRLFHYGPLVALSITFLCYIVAVLDTVLWLFPIYGDKSFHGILNVLILTAWLALILDNFFRAVLVGPGYVPLHWHPKNRNDEKYLPYCHICEGFKPPRSHHCRICQRCVLKMDHHCPWINNCCGHFNHTNFVLFVTFALIGCLHGVVVVVSTVLSQVLWYEQYLSLTSHYISFTHTAFYFNLFAGSLAFANVVAIGVMCYFELKTILYNATTIELRIIKKAKDRNRKRLKDFIYPYDYGKKNNFLQVINWKCKPVGDGYSFPVLKGCTKFTLAQEHMEQIKEMEELFLHTHVTRPYSGSRFSLAHGFCTFVHSPCINETLMSIEPGEKVLVFTVTKYWFCGKKILNKPHEYKRGWFPSRCVVGLVPGERKDCEKGSITTLQKKAH